MANFTKNYFDLRRIVHVSLFIKYKNLTLKAQKLSTENTAIHDKAIPNKWFNNQKLGQQRRFDHSSFISLA